MSSSTHLRSVDLLRNSDITASGFVIRKRTPVSALSALFMAISVGVVGVAGVWFYDVLTGFYLCLGTGGVVAYVAIHLNRMQKIQQSTEFLNALLSSAIGHNFRFSMIVRSDGEIVYVNRAFQSVFSRFVAQPTLNLAMLCSMQNVSTSDHQRLSVVMAHSAEVVVTIGMNVGESQQPDFVSLHIEPIEFPAGYVLVRGV